MIGWEGKKYGRSWNFPDSYISKKCTKILFFKVYEDFIIFVCGFSLLLKGFRGGVKVHMQFKHLYNSKSVYLVLYNSKYCIPHSISKMYLVCGYINIPVVWLYSSKPILEKSLTFKNSQIHAL